MARPSEYDFELCKEICDNVALGSNVISVLDSDERFPAWNTFRRWKNDFAELSAMYVKAQQDKSEACLKEMQNGLGVKFKDYFVVQKVAKVATKNEKPKTVKRKKGE